MSIDRRQAGSGQMRRGGRDSIAPSDRLAPSNNLGSLLHAHYNTDSLGATWVDKTGHGFNLTLGGTVDTEASKFGALSGVRFNAAADLASTTAITGIAAGSRPWALAFVRQISTAASWGPFDLSTDETLNGSGFAAWGATTAGIMIDKDTGPSTSNAPCDKSLPFLEILGLRSYALVVGFNGDLLYYQDGNTAKTLDDAQTNLILGKLYAGDGFAGNGWINDFALLNAPPTEVQIRTHYEWLAQRVPSFGTAIGLDHANRGVLLVFGQSNAARMAFGGNGMAAHFYKFMNDTNRPDGIRYRTVAQQSRNLATEFAKGSVTYPELYPQVIEAISQAASNDTITVLWMQGEADGSDAGMAAAYQANVTTFIGNVIADSGRSDIRWIFSRLSTAQTNVVHLATINTAIDAVVAAAPTLRASFNTDDLTCADGTHYDDSQYSIIWTRARAEASALYGTANW